MSFRLEADNDQAPESEPARRRSVPFFMLTVAVVMTTFAGGVWATYRIMVRHSASGPVPVIRAEERPVKIPPVNPGGMTVPDQDKFVLNRETPTDTRVEQLLPPPEAPLPRPAPVETMARPVPPQESDLTTPTAALASSASDAASAAPNPLPALAVQPPPFTPAPPASVPPASAPPAVPEPAAPAPTATAMATPAPAAPPAARSYSPTDSVVGWRLQLGAVRTPDQAQKEWSRLKTAQADVLGSLPADMVRVDLGDRGIFYRIQAGPLADADAQSACAELRRRKVACLLVKR
jgi:cell division septation protein DedD